MIPTLTIAIIVPDLGQCLGLDARPKKPTQKAANTVLSPSQFEEQQCDEGSATEVQQGEAVLLAAGREHSCLSQQPPYKTLQGLLLLTVSCSVI